MLNGWVDIGSKILELILAGEMILFVKLAWEGLWEAKISFPIPYPARVWQLLSNGCTCHVWTPGSSTDNTAQIQRFLNFSEPEI